MRLMKTLCQRIRRTSLSLEEAVSLDLPTRLGRHLLRMADQHGVPTPRGTRIALRMSQGRSPPSSARRARRSTGNCVHGRMKA